MLIYKTPLATYDNRIKLPRSARLLDVQLQDGEPFMWYSFEAGTEEVERQFLVFGTGQPIPYKSLQHIATVQSGAFVWHYFENLAHRP